MLREGNDMRSSCVRLSRLAYVRRRTILRAPLQLPLYLLCFHKRALAVVRGYVRGYTVAVVVWKKHTSFWCVSVPLLSTPDWQVQVPSFLDEGRLCRERNKFHINYFPHMPDLATEETAESSLPIRPLSGNRMIARRGTALSMHPPEIDASDFQPGAHCSLIGAGCRPVDVQHVPRRIPSESVCGSCAVHCPATADANC